MQIVLEGWANCAFIVVQKKSYFEESTDAESASESELPFERDDKQLSGRREGKASVGEEKSVKEGGRK